MGKYVEALNEIERINKTQLQDTQKSNDAIDKIKKKICEAEDIIDWKKQRSFLSKDKADKYTRCALIVSIVMIFVGLVALLFINDVESSRLLAIIFLQKTFRAKAFKKAIWTAIILLSGLSAINGFVNLVLNLTKVYTKFYRSIERIIFKAVQLGFAIFMINKFNASMYGDKNSTFEALFDFCLSSSRQSRFLFIFLFLVCAYYMICLVCNFGRLATSLIHDICARLRVKPAEKELADLTEELNNAETELENLQKKHESDLDIANQLAQALKTTGEELYNSAIEANPVDEELIKKAIEYDNSEASYWYYRNKRLAILNDKVDGKISDIEIRRKVVELIPYIETAEGTFNRTAKFFEIEAKIFKDGINSYNLSMSEQALNKLLKIKSEPDFDEAFLTPCIELINELDKRVKALKEEEEKEKKQQRKLHTAPKTSSNTVSEYEIKKQIDAVYGKSNSSYDNFPDEPKQWKEDFVKKYPYYCKETVRVTLLLIIEYLKKGNYEAAIVGFDQALAGIIKLDSIGFIDGRPYFTDLSFLEGLVIMCGPTNYDIEKRRNVAAAMFADSIDTSNGGIKEYAQKAMSDVKSRASTNSFKRRNAPNFPYDVIDSLSDSANRLSQ